MFGSHVIFRKLQKTKRNHLNLICTGSINISPSEKAQRDKVDHNKILHQHAYHHKKRR